MTEPVLKVVEHIQDEYSRLVIERLEEMLAMAKARPQRSVVIHMLDAEDMRYHTACCSLNLAEHLGLLEMAKYNIIALP